MISLQDALAGVHRLGFDTAPVIYFVEAHPRYDALVTEVFQRVADGVIEGITSVITLSEVLVPPLQQGNFRLAQEYRDLLLNSQNFATCSIDPDIAARSAQLRVAYGFRTPDALQLATAIAVGCEAFLTNDPTLQRVKELPVLVLDDLEL
jgi:predicted nucleic acid-binding protein